MVNGDKSKKSGTLRFSLAICILIAFALGASSLHAQSQSSGDRHRPVLNFVPASPPPGYVPPVVATLRLRPGDSNDEYWVKATENGYALHTCPTQLTIAVGSATHQKVIFTYKSCKWLLYMFPPEVDDSVLVTVWEGGSAVWVRAFHIKGGKVTLVFDRASRGQPEFPWDTILLNVGVVSQPDGNSSPKNTEIWTWTGQKYKLAATVPFNQRYDALQKLPPSAWK